MGLDAGACLGAAGLIVSGAALWLHSERGRDMEGLQRQLNTVTKEVYKKKQGRVERVEEVEEEQGQIPGSGVRYRLPSPRTAQDNVNARQQRHNSQRATARPVRQQPVVRPSDDDGEIYEVTRTGRRRITKYT